MSEITNVSEIDFGPVVAFLPCRKGSERVPKKNIRPFGKFQYGLVEIKLGQLLACPEIDKVVVSTNDEEIFKIVEGKGVGGRLVLHRRDEVLSTSETSTDSLVSHARDLIAPFAPNANILWTHVTSPFVTAEHYSRIISDYGRALAQGHDSLMTTTLLHTFLWNDVGPINYDRAVEKWPRTQTLRPVHEINSAAFLAPVAVYAKRGDRIGANPRLHVLEKLVALDIDWEDDFKLAEQLLLCGIVTT